MGGAQLRPEDYDPRLNAFVLSLSAAGLLVGTASGDSPEYVASFFRVVRGPPRLRAVGPLCGSSAGMNCWFEASTTDSFDLSRRPTMRRRWCSRGRRWRRS
jgi:hypothetical protein